MQGQHGADCRQRCECRHGGLCDRQKGHCVCQPGWTGEKCESRKWGTGVLTMGTACCISALVLHRGRSGGQGIFEQRHKIWISALQRELAGAVILAVCPGFAHRCAFCFPLRAVLKAMVHTEATQQPAALPVGRGMGTPKAPAPRHQCKATGSKQGCKAGQQSHTPHPTPFHSFFYASLYYTDPKCLASVLSPSK